MSFKQFEKSSVGAISMSRYRDPFQEPEVQFHLNTTFPAQEKTVRLRQMKSASLIGLEHGGEQLDVYVIHFKG